MARLSLIGRPIEPDRFIWHRCVRRCGPGHGTSIRLWIETLCPQDHSECLIVRHRAAQVYQTSTCLSCVLNLHRTSGVSDVTLHVIVCRGENLHCSTGKGLQEALGIAR